MRTSVVRLAATAILSCVTVATSDMASAARPDADIGKMAGDSLMPIGMHIWNSRGLVAVGESPTDQDLTGLFDASAQFAAHYSSDTTFSNLSLMIPETTDLMPVIGPTGSDELTVSSLMSNVPSFAPTDLGYHNPEAPLAQSVSWALMIGGIGFAAALFRLSRHTRKIPLV